MEAPAMIDLPDINGQKSLLLLYVTASEDGKQHAGLQIREGEARELLSAIGNAAVALQQLTENVIRDTKDPQRAYLALLAVMANASTITPRVLYRDPKSDTPYTAEPGETP